MNSYPNVANKSYIPYINIFEETNNIKFNLYDYQKRSVSKMLAIEKGEYNMLIDAMFYKKYNSDDMDEVEVKFNPFLGIIDNQSKCEIKLESKGGILADEMGLGKTITSFLSKIKSIYMHEEYKVRTYL